MKSNLPTGTLTFLFTDLEGSTQAWEQHPKAMEAALVRHDAHLRQAVEDNQGQIVKTTGDGLHAVFTTAARAVRAALDAQKALAAEEWEFPEPLRVRMALHTGEAQLREGDYYGPVSNRAARLMSIAHGEQTLLSQATAALVSEALPNEATLTDLGDHRLKDLSSPERVFQLSAPPLPSEFPPLRSLDAYPHNLPLKLSSFVGREREIAEVKNLLEETRLLTLFGPGGTGKTRLMLQVAADVLDDYKDGVWRVELASLSDPDQLTQRVASTFSLQDGTNQSLLNSLTDYLRFKELLLLLDNSEHMVTACAQLAEHLLQACPKITVVVTSREALAITGEVTYQVPSLALPSQDDAPMEDLQRSEAVQLFVERARESLPSFELTPAKAASVARICRRLDGIPLAIELAAARIQMLSAEQIAERLQDRFQLLTGGSRTALPRQQTLRALIDWSWNLLSKSEQHLLQHLSVFSGGWTLDAAEAIAGSHGDLSSNEVSLDVFSNLTQLVQKSLVVAERGLEGDVRYQLLESIRHYAHDRLVEADEARAMRDRHAEYFIQYFCDSTPHLRGPDMIIWMKRLEKEIDNLRAAMDWSLETQLELALHLVGCFFYLLGGLQGLLNLPDIRNWLEAVLKRTEELPIDDSQDSRSYLLARSQALSLFALINFAEGDNEASQAKAEKAVTLARQLGATRELVGGLQILSLACALVGNLDEALNYTQEAIDLSRENDYRWELSTLLSPFTFAQINVYGVDRAKRYTKEGMQIAQEIGNPWLIGMQTHTLAQLAAKQGDLEEAIAQYEESIKLFQEQENLTFTNIARSDMGHTLRMQGDIEGALRIYEQTILDWFEIGNRGAIAHQLECFAYIAATQGEPQRAAKLLGAAEALREVTNSSRVGNEQEEYEQAVEQLRGQLGEGGFMDAFNDGQTLSVEAAINFALGG